MLAKLIVIEGPDRVGKETQSKMLVRSLEALSQSAHSAYFDCTTAHVEIPMKSSVTYPLIYWMLKSGWAKKLPNAFQFVQFLNKLGFQLFALRRLMRVNDFVVMDRWSLSGLVYGRATGVNMLFNDLLYKMLKKPDVTLVLCGKTHSRQEEADTYESDDFLQSFVTMLYQHYCAHFPHHQLVGNHGTKEEVHMRMMSALLRFGVLEEESVQ